MKAENYNQSYSADPHQEILDYIKAHYEIHYNQLTALPEFRPLGSNETFQVADKRQINTLVLELNREGIDCGEREVKRFLYSEWNPNFHPMMAYMEQLPQWDGVDRVTPLAHRISKSLTWTNGFHRWLLGMASQFMGRCEQCANALVPILVSHEQGWGKSTFCRNLLPPELQFYYTDSLDVTSGNHVEQRLGTMALINLDELDQFGPTRVAKLKNVLQMKTCSYRRLYSNQFVMLPRMASFIGTSNSNQLLYDPTGSRRFLCVTVEGMIDNSPIDHPQLFAQLRAELERGERPYLTRDEEREIEENNRLYYHISPEEDVFNRCFAIPSDDVQALELTSADIFTRLRRTYPEAMRQSNPHNFGHTLLMLGVPRRHTERGNLFRVLPLAR